MTLTELRLDALMLSNTVSAQYNSDNLLRNLNLHYDDAVAYIWSVDGSWRFDEGLTATNLPIAMGTLASGQWDYQLPSTARRIHKIEILDSQDNIHQLGVVTDKTEPKRTDDGLPTHYKMVGRSIFLHPAPNYNKDNGLIIHLSKSVTPLAVGTDEPRIDREFHRYLSYGATRDWYFSKSNITKQRAMDRELDKMKMAMREFYGKRHIDHDASIKIQREDYR